MENQNPVSSTFPQRNHAEINLNKEEPATNYTTDALIKSLNTSFHNKLYTKVQTLLKTKEFILEKFLSF